MRVRFAFALTLCASQGSAACSGSGDPYFDINPVQVNLCVGEKCEVAVRSRTCGNIDAVTENFSTKSVIWIFRQRLNDAGSEDDQFFVLNDPLDPEEIPLSVVDGRSVRFVYAGVPVDPDIVSQMTCMPLSSDVACDFVDSLLNNLREP